MLAIIRLYYKLNSNYTIYMCVWVPWVTRSLLTVVGGMALGTIVAWCNVI